MIDQKKGERETYNIDRSITSLRDRLHWEEYITESVLISRVFITVEIISPTNS